MKKHINTTYKDFIKEDISIQKNDNTSLENITKRLDTLKQDINEFNTKKNSIEKVILDNVNDEKDISQVIEKMVGDNKFLSMYLPIARKMAQIKKADLRIEYYVDLLKSREEDLATTSKLSDLDEKQEQQNKIKKQIEEIKEKSSDLKDKIKELESTIKEEKSNLDKYIKEEKEKLEEDIKDMNIDLS